MIIVLFNDYIVTSSSFSQLKYAFKWETVLLFPLIQSCFIPGGIRRACDSGALRGGARRGRAGRARQGDARTLAHQGTRHRGREGNYTLLVVYTMY